MTVYNSSLIFHYEEKWSNWGKYELKLGNHELTWGNYELVHNYPKYWKNWGKYELTWGNYEQHLG